MLSSRSHDLMAMATKTCHRLYPRHPARSGHRYVGRGTPSPKHRSLLRRDLG